MKPSEALKLSNFLNGRRDTLQTKSLSTVCREVKKETGLTITTTTLSEYETEMGLPPRVRGGNSEYRKERSVVLAKFSILLAEKLRELDGNLEIPDEVRDIAAGK